MTTVAYRDGVLVADSCYTASTEDGGSRQYNCKKIFEVNVGPRRFVVGFAGGSGWSKYIRWLVQGCDLDDLPEFEKGDDFEAIVIEQIPGQPQRVYCVDRHMEAEPIVEEYHAIGSGAKCAFTAMDCGKSAFEAVELAARRDPYTRAPFQACKA